MDTLQKIPIRIIKEQELVIGPIAWDEAKKVSGLVVDYAAETVSFVGDGKEAIDKLVAQYERLFGRASHEVCREAVQDLIKELKAEEIPSSLK